MLDHETTVIGGTLMMRYSSEFLGQHLKSLMYAQVVLHYVNEFFSIYLKLLKNPPRQKNFNKDVIFFHILDSKIYV